MERPHSDNFPDLMYRPVTTLKRRFSLAVKSKDTLGAPGKAHKPAQRLQKRVACLRVKLMAKDALSAHARDQASEQMLRNTDWRSGTRNYRPNLVHATPGSSLAAAWCIFAP